MFKSSIQTSSPSAFTLYRKANQVAQSRPELAAELRLLAAYGKKKQDKKPQGGSKARSTSAAQQRAMPKPVFAAEVRVPRIFCSLFDNKPALA
ncbi:hypothetical protein [Oxalicibacterium faecigallinarum]|uniref:Uncharacterized protein n=1 Tax=Oxalicibacterium faecigallinarum TaxID=573741 RepID=A0A8J3AQQ8_9BURK|nr:hypothetical protein [Oxalicibacterium faecigallinarum]GGI19248.1 hypothetical protein GCM10008066_18130 [Oxalicibacterium faecigallinarum]